MTKIVDTETKTADIETGRGHADKLFRGDPLDKALERQSKNPLPEINAYYYAEHAEFFLSYYLNIEVKIGCTNTAISEEVRKFLRKNESQINSGYSQFALIKLADLNKVTFQPEDVKKDEEAHKLIAVFSKEAYERFGLTVGCLYIQSPDNNNMRSLYMACYPFEIIKKTEEEKISEKEAWKRLSKEPHMHDFMLEVSKSIYEKGLEVQEIADKLIEERLKLDKKGFTDTAIERKLKKFMPAEIYPDKEIYDWKEVPVEKAISRFFGMAVAKGIIEEKALEDSGIMIGSHQPETLSTIKQLRDEEVEKLLERPLHQAKNTLFFKYRI